MLQQPYECFPSSLAGEGYNIIDAGISNNFSAYVSGNAPVTAYQLIIRKNDGTNDIVYDTGVTELTNPFYCKDRDGESVQFSVSVPNDSGMINETASGYKWNLTLWETYNVETPASTRVIGADNHFYALDALELRISEEHAPDTIDSRTHTWDAFLTQAASAHNNASTAQCLPVAWYRWELYQVLAGGGETLVDKTKTIYQAPKIEYEYDGLASGTSYKLYVYACDTYGKIHSANHSFIVAYNYISSEGTVEISTTNTGVRIAWPSISFIEGVAYDAGGNEVTLSDNTFLNDAPITGEKALDMGSEATIVEFQGSENFELKLDMGSNIVIECKVKPYIEGSEALICEWSNAQNSTIVGTIKHVGFAAGLSPNFVPGGVTPNGGQKGEYEYTTTENTYSAPANSFLDENMWVTIKAGDSHIEVIEHAEVD